MEVAGSSVMRSLAVNSTEMARTRQKLHITLLTSMNDRGGGGCSSSARFSQEAANMKVLVFVP